MEGGVATELKVHVINNGTRTLGYFANGVNVERDEWVEGQVPIDGGEVAITFEAMVGPKSWKPSVIALDDIVFREGESCPKKENCSEDEFWCAPSRICIPAYLVRDGISDCYDGSDEACMYGERPCQPGTSGTECVPEASWCDGIRDCPEGDDERDCANCTTTEWECLSHQCIPEMQRCDGTPQCPDQSDEFQCVKHTNASGEVEVRHSGNQVGILCADNIDRGTADYLCSQSGSGQYLSHFQSYVVSNGLVAIPSENNPGILPHRRLQQVSSCYSLGLRCGTIECGVPITSLLETFVLHGSDAQQGEWPWQISIMRNGGHICGGTIISPDWIVTAAHCVDDYSASNYDVGAGSLVKNQAYISGQVRSVQSKYIHPNYSLPDTNPSHTDLALLRLSSPLRFDNFTRPACIGHSVEDLRNCYVTGWGYTYYDESRNSVSPTLLQEEQVQILNHGECRSNWYNTTGFRYTYVQDDVLCVDNREPFGSLCYTLLSTGRKHLASQFNFTFRYIDDVLSINNPNFADHLHEIYPHELKIKETTESDRSASYLDILLSFDTKGHLNTPLYDKRDDFSFHITNFPFMSSNIPSSPAFGVFVSQLIPYAGACPNMKISSLEPGGLQVSYLFRVMVHNG
ncbi:hypothetical protein FSP39_009018 [Pinctada imbricata]|uniref:Uncharacterized protein n=1 Tax=Pinctada imbricata TaxID=66713 RepID=A0AA89BYS5_PINIB|nr:hypothetical protein FSP39_009018 [Pinctada imbricata]